MNNLKKYFTISVWLVLLCETDISLFKLVFLVDNVLNLLGDGFNTNLSKSFYSPTPGISIFNPFGDNFSSFLVSYIMPD